jgi:uncharacterized protein YndB with AHSA1/START domain
MEAQLPWDDAVLQTQAADAVVHVSRTYPAPKEEVYAAWTEAELLTQWFRPANGFSTAELDVRPGGRYRITMDPQGTLPGPADIVGTYLEVEPSERLVFTWSWEVPPPEELTGIRGAADPEEIEARIENLRRIDSEVTVLFRETDGLTEVSITHQRLDTANLRAFHIFGWQMVLESLAKIL